VPCARHDAVRQADQTLIPPDTPGGRHRAPRHSRRAGLRPARPAAEDQLSSAEMKVGFGEVSGNRWAARSSLTCETRTSVLLEQLPGHHHALDLVGALVDLGDRGLAGSSRR
jgi:hypothetical protein